MKNKLEVLAPAGNLENLKIAVNNGADAVYLGMQNFNARNKAGNFDESNIKDVVSYCHLMGVKVYLTVNTLVKDSEIDEFLKMVKAAVDAKVDAYLVQDLGVAYILKKYFDGIVLHSSTQLGVHNLQGAKVLEELGFRRVVLSREATLDDIKDISKNTNLEIEYFVQGALCVAFSGQCYMSSLMHNESGNRGRCLQLCRLKYRSKINGEPLKAGYLLSPRDLCLIDKLQELVSAGVASLKIEGRMRRSGYVAAVTSEYRKAVDYIQNNKAFDTKNSIQNFKKVFYRGEYNDGLYLTEKDPNIINPLYQNHRGVQIGKVLSVKPFKNLNEIVIKSSHELVQNDGIKCVGKQEIGLGVGNVKKLGKDIYGIISTAKPSINDDVYLTVDKAFEDKLISAQSKLKINATFRAKIGDRASLVFEHNDITTQVFSESIVDKAKTSPLTPDSAKEQISKLNDTEFTLDCFTADLDDIFMPKSVLNEMRRNACERLKENILAAYNMGLQEVKYLGDEAFIADKQTKAKTEKLSIAIINEKVVTIPKIDIIYSPLDYNDIKSATCIRDKAKAKLYLALPNVANKKDMEVIRKLYTSVNFDGVVINNIYGIALAKELNIAPSNIIAGTGMNITNAFAKKFLNNFGITKIMSSIEFNLVENSENMYGGVPTLMTLCHCPYKVNFGGDCRECHYQDGLTYTQESGKVFRIRRYRLNNCYFELLPQDFRLNGKDIIDMRE